MTATVHVGILEAAQSTRQVSVTTPGGLPVVQACSSSRDAEQLLRVVGVDVDLDDPRQVEWDGDPGVWPVGAAQVVPGPEW